ncbi:hypothetical protein WICMUC_005154 [Wickerhamomyces mucosus]|uniref:Protein kinase domain-containing protein n=1 Tax=Wickerhamomyces mucosus TaxID=1378264 RepID=A0A9P8T6J2_9ASCO|nr:hypothetical protein WICMUC_005154 [Wickerhamomyces mucosus]
MSELYLEQDFQFLDIDDENIKPFADKNGTMIRRRSSVRSKFNIQPLAEHSQSYTFDNDYAVSEDEEEYTEEQSEKGKPVKGKTDLRNRKLSDFDELRILGIGSYGRVHLVKDRFNSRLYAKKTIKKAKLSVDETSLKNSRNERDILAKISHPAIVKLFYAFHDEEDINFILEYIPGGEIFYHLNSKKRFSETDSAFYLAEISEALHHLHTTAGVVYRDLKPENVMLNSKGHVVLTDFGLSSMEEKCKSLLGTPQFTAPEVLSGGSYSYPADWWSFGIMMFDMITGDPPFKSGNKQKLFEKIIKSKITYPFYLSTDCKDLLMRLLNKNPEKRLPIDKDYEQFKRHRFFRKVDWKSLRSTAPPFLPNCSDLENPVNFDFDYIDEELRSKNSILNGAIPIPISQQQSDENSHTGSLFKGFSFVASSSLLESQF